MAGVALSVSEVKGVLKFGRATLILAALLLAGCVTRLPESVRRQSNIEYARVDGIPLLLDIYSPKEPRGKLPALIWIHGGSWKSGSKDFCPIGFMATQNCAIVSIDYRLSGVAPFPAQLHDCKAVVRWLRAHAAEYNLDSDRIGACGASAGGHLAALLGTTADVPELEGNVGGNLNFSSRVKAVCVFYPPTDLDKLVVSERLRRSANTEVAKLLGGPLEDHLQLAEMANPIRHINKDAVPFFIIHGAQDTLVPVEQSRMLYNALKAAGVEAQLEVVPGGHGIIAPPRVADEIYRFFERHLGIFPPTK